MGLARNYKRLPLSVGCELFLTYIEAPTLLPSNFFFVRILNSLRYHHIVPGHCCVLFTHRLGRKKALRASSRPPRNVHFTPVPKPFLEK